MKTMQPRANQITMAFFGLTNVGKSHLMNNLFEQEISIVADRAGTTTDPVSKSIELKGLGAVNVIDTAGLDDKTELGKLRVKKTEARLEVANFKVLVTRADKDFSQLEIDLLNSLEKNNETYAVAVNFADKEHNNHKKDRLKKHPHVYIDNLTGEGVTQFKKLLMGFSHKLEYEISPLEGLVNENDLILLVAPIDLAAPKDRLIQPQVATLRDSLDKDCASLLVKERELSYFYHSLRIAPKLVITDSQAFSKVAADIPMDQQLTSFSILFARKKGDLRFYVESLKKMKDIQAGAKVLVLESCAHHKQADDIGTVKIPRLFRQIIQPDVEFLFSKEIPDDNELSEISLVISCGSCMVSRTMVLNRLKTLQAKGIPAINYGLFLAEVNGLLPRALEPFPDEYNIYCENSDY